MREVKSKVARRWEAKAPALFTRRSVLCAGVSGAAILTFSGFASAEIESEITARERSALEEIATAAMQRCKLPGLSVAIAKRGRFAYARGFGFSDAKTRESVSPNHRFRIASISKPLTSVAIFSLIEQGRLRTGDRVFGRGAILQTEYGTKPYRRYIEDITVEHFLTHTGGGWRNDKQDPMFHEPRLNQHQLISWTLDNLPLVNPPGTAFAYSNFGYCVLGRVIEKLTQQPYARYVRAAVLDRCGISDMRIAANGSHERAEREVAYYGQGDDPYAINVARMDSHGGWIASPSDLVRFATHVDGLADTPNILQPETIRLMTTPSVNPRYAKGWAINKNNWFHNGSLPGTSSIMVRTGSGLCWAAITNSRCREPDSGQVLDKMMWDMVRAVKIFSV